VGFLCKARVVSLRYLADNGFVKIGSYSYTVDTCTLARMAPPQTAPVLYMK
jgi:hypothetical protein